MKLLEQYAPFLIHQVEDSHSALIFDQTKSFDIFKNLIFNEPTTNEFKFQNFNNNNSHIFTEEGIPSFHNINNSEIEFIPQQAEIEQIDESSKRDESQNNYSYEDFILSNNQNSYIAHQQQNQISGEENSLQLQTDSSLQQREGCLTESVGQFVPQEGEKIPSLNQSEGEEESEQKYQKMNDQDSQNQYIKRGRKKRGHILDNVGVNKLKNFYKTFMNRISPCLKDIYGHENNMVDLIDHLCSNSNQRNFLALFPHLKENFLSYYNNETEQMEVFNKDLHRLRKTAFKMFGQNVYHLIRVLKCSKSFRQTEEFVYGCIFFADRSAQSLRKAAFPKDLQEITSTQSHFNNFTFRETDFSQKIQTLDQEMTQNSEYKENLIHQQKDKTSLPSSQLIDIQANKPQSIDQQKVNLQSIQNSNSLSLPKQISPESGLKPSSLNKNSAKQKGFVKFVKESTKIEEEHFEKPKQIVKCEHEDDEHQQQQRSFICQDQNKNSFMENIKPQTQKKCILGLMESIDEALKRKMPINQKTNKRQMYYFP